ncbi:hypothetical protein LTR36_007735 [Oleoguttula mirabilis]|uniref:White collar 1 protein n=1 Tax=Oleoguttula mirabilis TaxID=1507867 RepID=A0AAV9JW39_9PEZI|nr:hypothetical protein LTR36_007735 [Oleoguttula mirabilis]
MNGYSYNAGYGANVLDNSQQYGGQDTMMIGQDAMGNGMGGGQSLDEIVNQNADTIRRQSMSQQYGASMGNVDATTRRISMMDYGSGSPATPMASFGFDASAGMDRNGVMAGASTTHTSQLLERRRQSQAQSRRQSGEHLALDTNFPSTTQSYGAMLPPVSAFISHSHPQNGMELTSPYLDRNIGMPMDTLGAHMSDEPMNMDVYNQPRFSNSMISSPMHPNPPHSTPISATRGPVHDTAGGSILNMRYGSQSGNSSGSTVRGTLSRSHSLQTPDAPTPTKASTPTNEPVTATQPQQPSNSDPPRQPQHAHSGSRQDRGMHIGSSAPYDGINGPTPITSGSYNPNNQGFAWEAPEGGWPSTMSGKPHMQSIYKNAYSSTGFDMLGVLMRVATRPNAVINIGSVDLSCAFVVCDAEKDDVPIVYCSDNFERLTGYTKHMILGRNCRFLQSPDGQVAPGTRRKYVDDDSVLYLKNMVNLQREAQISLINYRRGGQPFMNLLTMIPITWDSDKVKFFVGFQVDLVEQPNAVTNKNPDGSYSINYQRGLTMPRYVMNAPPDASQKSDLGQTVPRDDVSAILTTIGSGDSEYAKRMWDKVLLENTDDVVHVLSLKGLFQWVSPSAARILEYEQSEIIGTALSSLCHPSDIVPVTRELKDTSTGASLNVVFRIRRKNSGYMWFEGHGSLHTEQGKGRKSIIMVGRERPVYALSRSDIINAGGIGENELWTKMSTSGMFLFVSSTVRQLLDRQPEELVGVSIQSLMRAESKQEFGRILEHARTGKKASVKHEMINRRGQVLSAFTTLYPGDATEGMKPTFIVAQTRLIKFSRGSQSSRPRMYPKAERNSSESVHSEVASSHPMSVSGSHTAGEATPNPGMSAARYAAITTKDSAATYAGQNGLMIGHQDASLASEDNLFDELKTTKSSSWQYEIRQLEKRNRMLAEEVQALIAAKKKRKRRKTSNQTKDCANCHTKVTPEWRRGPSGQRDLCNSCGLRWAKVNGRVSPRTSSQQSVHSGKAPSEIASPRHPAGLSHARSVSKTDASMQPPKSNVPAPGAAAAPRDSPKAVKPLEGHGASMEGASGVPEQIDEDIEPD